jgi:uncharacterized protein (TIGR03067 family)
MSINETIIGHWKLISCEGGDESAARKILGTLGDMVTYEKTSRLSYDPNRRYRINAGAVPQEIDHYIVNPISLSKGIMELKESELILCMAKFGKPRPKEFQSHEPDSILLRLHRFDPDSESKAEQKQIQRSQAMAKCASAMELLGILNGGSNSETPGIRGPKWLPFCTVRIESNRLWVGDPEMSWAELHDQSGCVIELPNGEYELSVHCESVETATEVTRLRVCRMEVENPQLGDAIGTAGTDSAAIGVCDSAAFLASLDQAFGEDEDAAHAYFSENVREVVGILEPLVGGAVLPYVGTGSDGGGRVHELLLNGKRIGIELNFRP